MAGSSYRVELDIGGRSLSFIAHEWLRRDSYRDLLLRVARHLTENDTPVPMGETRSFRSLHATAEAIRELVSAGADMKDARVVEFVELYDRLCDVLFRANIGLVYDMKRRAAHTDLDDADVISDGQLALLRAVRSFNPWMGYRFSTYACRSIIRSFNELGRRKKQNARLMTERFERARAERRRGSKAPVSTDEWALERLGNIVAENSAELTSAEQLVITQRLLRGDGIRPTTLGAVGRMLNLSKERVRQLQITALAKLRAALMLELSPDHPVRELTDGTRRAVARTTRVAGSSIAIGHHAGELAA